MWVRVTKYFNILSTETEKLFFSSDYLSGFMGFRLETKFGYKTAILLRNKKFITFPTAILVSHFAIKSLNIFRSQILTFFLRSTLSV